MGTWAREALGCRYCSQQVTDQPAQVAVNQRSALAPAQRPVHPLISVGMLVKQSGGQGDLNGTGGIDAGQVVLELIAHPVEARRQQGFLVAEVAVEGGSADVGPVQDVLDRGLVVALFEDKREERVVQQLAGASNPPITHRSARTRCFPDISASPFGTGHMAPIARWRNTRPATSIEQNVRKRT